MMSSVLAFAVGLLQSALALLGFVQAHPELPQSSRDQAQVIARQAITQATNALSANSATGNTGAGSPQLSAFPASGAVPLTVNFTTGYPDGYQTTTNYDIDFGDGTVKSMDGQCSPSHCSINHTYTNAGVYVITLRKADGPYQAERTWLCKAGELGCSPVGTLTLTVRASNPSGSGNTTSQSPTISVSSPVAGQTITVTPSTHDSPRVAWQSQNAPSGAQVYFSLIDASTGAEKGYTNVSGAGAYYTTGNGTWDHPSYCNGDICMSLSAWPGRYKIRAYLLPGPSCQNTSSGTCPSVAAQAITAGDSGVFTITNAYLN